MMDQQNELRNLNNLQNQTAQTNSWGTVRYIIRCPGNAEMVLSKAKEVMIEVIQQTPESQSISVPNWFVNACSPEKTPQEAEQWLKWWRSLPLQEQERAAQEDWSLENWLYWMYPEMRQWFWRKAIVENSTTIRLDVEIKSHPFAWGALEWLFKASGADDIQPEE